MPLFDTYPPHNWNSHPKLYGVVSRYFLMFMGCLALFLDWRGLFMALFRVVVALTMD
jgi:hypothetical protein